MTLGSGESFFILERRIVTPLYNLGTRPSQSAYDDILVVIFSWC